MQVVARINTPLGRESTALAVQRAWFDVLGMAPEQNALALVLALVWIETGAGDSCFNWNLGNITAGESYGGDAWRPPWFEPGDDANARTLRLHELMLKGQAPRAFRAYASLDAGAHDLMLRLEHDFPEVLDAAASADPDTFREALAEKYSHDYQNKASTRTLAALMREFGGIPKASMRPPPAAGSLSSPPSASSASSSERS